MKRTALALSCSLLLLSVHPAAQQPRDNRRPALAGTALITGVVTSADAPARPLRRVRVMISGSELDVARSTITTDEGQFSFESLPAGRYTLTAAKEGYATTAFGAVRPGRPGRAVTVAAGETRQLRMQLPAGAVITGMVRDPHGDPAAGLNVVVLSRRFVPGTGEQRLQTTPTNAATDDRGIYRVFGLAAGSYLVTALPRFAAVGGFGEVTTVSREDIQRALSEVQGGRTSSRPGIPASIPPAPAATVRRASLSIAPTYFPGTTEEGRAMAITVAAGEVRTGVDFDLDYLPLASVEGHVSAPPDARVQVMLSKADPDSPYQTTTTASPGPDGDFTFRRVQPGHYVIQARAYSLAARAAGTLQATFWGRTEIIVAGEDLEGVGVPLEPTLTLAGDLVFEGTTTPPSLDGFKLPLQVTPMGLGTVPFPTPVVEGSQVVLRGVAPGTYRFTSSPQGIRTRVGPWWLKSIMIDDREILDLPLEIPPNAKSLRVAFSGQASQLSGVVTDRNGAAVSDGYVVVFSDDPRTWFLHSRRVAALQLKPDGRYTVSNLPSGDYFVAVSSDLENNEWFDPERLQALRQSATRVTVGENQSVSRDITVAQR